MIDRIPRYVPDRGFLFTLRPMRGVTIRAFDGGPAGTHHRIDVEVRADGKLVFPRGATYCAVPGHTPIDGIDARETVLSLVAMKPGDTDEEYFASYTPEQLAFAVEHGEEIDTVRSERYCDENGNVRRVAR